MDLSQSDNDEEKELLARPINNYFRVQENTPDNLVLFNSPFWFSNCMGKFYTVISIFLIVPFIIILVTAYWELIIFDRTNDTVKQRRRHLYSEWVTLQEQRLSDFKEFRILEKKWTSCLVIEFENGERIPLTDGLNEVSEERDIVSAIVNRWLLNESGSGL
eukprot:TRINITY_DN11645_c0_g1_i1.p1 TRINITY_DN11645_c0_g1~~TRINITY_DN11645_c0_g1_i1.p1  ORF type:complete len:161 (-),score=20.09 TRINITY_DN11645_c0_g1_i1:205-687(-)